jgi:hypothetical protein
MNMKIDKDMNMNMNMNMNVNMHNACKFLVNGGASQTQQHFYQEEEYLDFFPNSV